MLFNINSNWGMKTKGFKTSSSGQNACGMEHVNRVECNGRKVLLKERRSLEKDDIVLKSIENKDKQTVCP
jgi:hypothetical protein